MKGYACCYCCHRVSPDGGSRKVVEAVEWWQAAKMRAVGASPALGLGDVVLLTMLAQEEQQQQQQQKDQDQQQHEQQAQQAQQPQQPQQQGLSAPGEEVAAAKAAAAPAEAAAATAAATAASQC
jgi:hypothetical protein